MSIDTKNNQKVLRIAGPLPKTYVEGIRTHFESLGCKVNIRHTGDSHISLRITGKVLDKDKFNSFLCKAPL